jgi:thioredoxin 1
VKEVLTVVAGVCLLIAGLVALWFRPHDEVSQGFTRARGQGKFLMVEFGADWCPDCRLLSQELHKAPVRDYLSQNFVLVHVDVGEFDRNMNVAKSLGVNVGQGIPTAVFFTPEGRRIGATDHGELARASRDGSQDLLTFLKSVTSQKME